MSIARTAFKKIGTLIGSTKFLSPKVAAYLCKSTIQPCMECCFHVCAGTPSCYLEWWISYKNGYVGSLVLHLLPLLNLLLIVEM